MKKKLTFLVAIFLSFIMLGCTQAPPPPTNEQIPPLPPLTPPPTEILPPPPPETDLLPPPVQEEEISKTQKILALKNINIRKQINGEKIGLLTANNYLPYYLTTNGWHKVRYNNTTAYVSASESLSKIVPISHKPTPQPTESQQKIERVIKEGMKVLGTPYVYGAPRLLNWDFSFNPRFTGKSFDCSSFVQYAFYKGAKIKLYGDSRSMSKQYRTISHKNIRRGDILFMTTTNRQDNTGLERIGHVAIYLGNNQILHTYGTGGVKVQSYSNFWKNRFVHAKRVIE